MAGLSRRDAAAGLWNALQADWVAPVSDNYKLAELNDEDLSTEGLLRGAPAPGGRPDSERRAS